ncbi:unnamed protein product [Prorocentrum cordatum]|uniref:Uncharacterized protein n=1 Tax=Prorocentrum cordatum TaxID=2364126 RepID=A0ABN9ST90_9DINO|nr:unnamed protein product [Polarella glacialis]
MRYVREAHISDVVRDRLRACRGPTAVARESDQAGATASGPLSQAPRASEADLLALEDKLEAKFGQDVEAKAGAVEARFTQLKSEFRNARHAEENMHQLAGAARGAGVGPRRRLRHEGSPAPAALGHAMRLGVRSLARRPAGHGHPDRGGFEELCTLLPTPGRAGRRRFGGLKIPQAQPWRVCGEVRSLPRPCRPAPRGGGPRGASFARREVVVR